ncbi:DNA-processing protein DprA [Nesterenkonia ebinurensis]|uniref:DNA-processing protein DprA n=1 Tax=Nesterenkonia ebinurensis TaxID=2608252 RepID=UPI001CC34AB8|nr:DNA-processing protein DprA [Nesterenkonia ebinurensis]
MMLSMLAEPDDAVTGRLLSRLGGVEMLGLLESEGKVPGMGRVDAQVWRDRLSAASRPDELAGRLRAVEASGTGVVVPGDRDWPASLGDLYDREPFVLWTRGAASFLSRPVTDLLTITGSRAATSYGERVAGEIATDLARDGRVVVAGGAYGIEGAAHRAALAAGGDTIAILAGGIDRSYPAGHRDLLDQIAGVGLLVSETPPGASPTRHRFLARGRLLAALSNTTVVVEAGARSGARHTARQAHELDRNVGAVPGAVTSAASAGPHQLIGEQRARIVTHAGEIINMLHMREALLESPQRPPLGSTLSRDHARCTGGRDGLSL